MLFLLYFLSRRREGLLDNTETQYSNIYYRNQSSLHRLVGFCGVFFLMEKGFVPDSLSMEGGSAFENFWVQISIIPKEDNDVSRSHSDLRGRMHSLCAPPHLVMCS